MKKPPATKNTGKAEEVPRFLARGLGYSTTPVQGDAARDRSHWTRQEPESIPDEEQRAISLAKRLEEMEAAVERLRIRRGLARQVAEVKGQRAFRWV